MGLVKRGEAVGVDNAGGARRIEQERSLDGRGDVEQAVRDVGEPTAPAGDHVPHALGHGRERHPGPQRSVRSRVQRPVLAEVLDDLAGEEGVAVGLRPDGVDELRGDRGVRGGAHQLLDGLAVEPDEPQHAALRLAAQRTEGIGKRVPVGHLARAVGADHQ